MADTQPLAPTDAEIAALIPNETSWEFDIGPEEAIRFARAVLAKWGAQPVPAGYALVPVEATEAMHIAAAKVLLRASGLDGLPQRMLAAMIAAAPQPVAREPLTDEHLRVIERMHVYAHTATLMDFARAIERAHGITTTGRKDAP